MAAWLSQRDWGLQAICMQPAAAQEADPSFLRVQTTVAAYVLDKFGYKYSYRGWCVLILVGFVFIMRFGAVMATTRFSFNKR